MNKWIVSLLLGVALVVGATQVEAAGNKIWGFTALNGGAAGALDAIPVASLTAGDIAIGTVSNVLYVYQFSAADAGAETVPIYICPDDAADCSSGTWYQVSSWLASYLAVGADPADAGAVRLPNAAAIVWEDATEASITHVDNTGWLINTTHQLQFGDSGTYINQSADGTLAIVSDTNVKILINDEDLNISKTGANGITIGTNTGVDTITLGAINITTTGTVTAGAVTVSPSTAPTATFSDSDAPGADEEIAKIVGGYVDGADGSENGTLDLYVHEAGTTTSYIQLDGKNTQIEVNKNLIMADGKIIVFDESEADPNDADVRIAGADGRLIIDANNGANNESLTIDFDADSNKVTVSSTSGVTELNFSAINMVTTGYMDGGILVTKSTDATITVSGMSGFYINADDDAIAFNLPATPTNKAFCFANLLYARAITVNPDDADYIVHAGVTAAAGEAYVSSGARTDQVCVVGIDASYWLVTSERGTWAEETP